MNSERKSILNYTRFAKIASPAFHRVVCAVLVVTFGVAALPLWSVAAVMQKSDCCKGKSAGHCESSILRKARQRKPEPMCGLKPASIDDGITIIAEPANNQGPESRSVSRSMGRACPMECCASTSNSAQKRKEHDSARSHFNLIAPLRVGSKLAIGTVVPGLLFTGFDISPRGPPTT